MPSCDPRVSYPSSCPPKPKHVPTSLSPSGWTRHALCLAPRADTGAKCARQFTRAAAWFSGHTTRSLRSCPCASPSLQHAVRRADRLSMASSGLPYSTLAPRMHRSSPMIGTRSPPLWPGLSVREGSSRVRASAFPASPSVDSTVSLAATVIVRRCHHAADSLCLGSGCPFDCGNLYLGDRQGTG